VSTRCNVTSSSTPSAAVLSPGDVLGLPQATLVEVAEDAEAGQRGHREQHNQHLNDPRPGALEHRPIRTRDQPDRSAGRRVTESRTHRCQVPAVDNVR